MTYVYESKIRLVSYTLNVRDLKAMTSFYIETVGLSLLSESNDRVELTIDGQETLLILQKTEKEREASYGLYHTAILVPDRKSLGESLRHLIAQKAELEGGADHGYSEAVYLHDIEGNEIEIYCDKPVSEWDIRKDDRIIGVTEELDAQSLVDNVAPVSQPFKLPVGTRIGHVHLQVRHAQETSKVYQRVFNLGYKFSVKTGSWIASGNYHHHLAFNDGDGGLSSSLASR